MERDRIASTFLYLIGTFLFHFFRCSDSLPTSGIMMAPKDTPHLRVRIEPKLLARLEKSRQKSGNTLTGEIVERLEESFRRDDTKEHLKELSQLVIQELRPELAHGYMASQILREVELENQAKLAKTEQERDALLKEAAEIHAKVKELSTEDVELFARRQASALRAIDPEKKDE